METDILLDTKERKLVTVLERKDGFIKISEPYAIFNKQVPHSVLEPSENSIEEWIPINDDTKKRYVDWKADELTE